MLKTVTTTKAAKGDAGATKEELRGPNLVIDVLIEKIAVMHEGFDRREATKKLASYVAGQDPGAVDWAWLTPRLAAAGIQLNPAQSMPNATDTKATGHVGYGDAGHGTTSSSKALPKGSPLWGQAMTRDLEESASLPKRAAKAKKELGKLLTELGRARTDKAKDKVYKEIKAYCGQVGYSDIAAIGLNAKGHAESNDVGLTWLNTRLAGLGLPTLVPIEDPAIEARRAQMRVGDLRGESATITFAFRPFTRDDLNTFQRYGIKTDLAGQWNVALHGTQAKNFRKSDSPGWVSADVRNFTDAVQSESLTDAVNSLRNWMKADRPLPPGFHLEIDLWHVPEALHAEVKAALKVLGEELGAPLKFLETRTSQVMENARRSNQHSDNAQAFVERMHKKGNKWTEADREEHAALLDAQADLARGRYEN